MKIEKLKVPYAQIPNDLLSDKTLSFSAKGLWAYIQSKPNDYDFSSTRIIEETKEGIKSVQSCLRELENAGYLVRHRHDTGRVDYVLAFPATSNPLSPKGLGAQISNNNISNKDIVINNKQDTSITYEGEKGLSEDVKEIPSETSKEFFAKIAERGEAFQSLVSFLADKIKVAPAFVSEELVAFHFYWTEKTHSGKKERWQTEKTFEPKRRLATWFRNKKDWSKGRTQQPSKYQVEDTILK